MDESTVAINTTLPSKNPGILKDRFCPKCGEKLNENATYCSQCGTEVTGGTDAAEKNSSDARSAEHVISVGTFFFLNLLTFGLYVIY